MKKEIRNSTRKKREALSGKFIEKASLSIHEKLFSLREYRDAKSIMTYLSFDNEVDTLPIIENALKHQKLICAPRINKEIKIIEPVELKCIEDIDFSQKLPQPKTAKPVDKEIIDMVIVPGIAFDRYGNRVGFGAGYYDRFLKDFKKTKIAVAFDFQVVKDRLSVKPYDVPVDIIITEKRIITP